METELRTDYVERFISAVETGIDLSTYAVYLRHLETDILDLPDGEFKTEARRLMVNIASKSYVIQTTTTKEAMRNFVLPPIQALLDLVKKNTEAVL